VGDIAVGPLDALERECDLLDWRSGASAVADLRDAGNMSVVDGDRVEILLRPACTAGAVESEFGGIDKVIFA